MDRSYLSNAEVIQASRKFVCVRLETYENADEMKFMQSIYDYRTPTKNSLFAILDPSAKRHLVKPGRSMKTTFADGAAMAEGMKKVSAEYAKAGAMQPGKLGMPYLRSTRVALNVSSCDTQRLAVLYAPGKDDLARLEKLLLPLAWSERLIGNLLYVMSTDESDLGQIKDATKEPGVLLVEPGKFGMAARQVAFIKLGASPADALKTLALVADGNEMGSKDSQTHMDWGVLMGLKWEHPVKDEGAAESDRRGRRQRGGG